MANQFCVLLFVIFVTASVFRLGSCQRASKLMQSGKKGLAKVQATMQQAGTYMNKVDEVIQKGSGQLQSLKNKATGTLEDIKNTAVSSYSTVLQSTSSLTDGVAAGQGIKTDEPAKPEDAVIAVDDEETKTALKEGFEEMSTRFTKLENTLDGLLKEFESFVKAIQSIVQKSVYKDNVRIPLEKAQEAYKAFLKDPSKVTVDQFVHRCMAMDKPETVRRWLYHSICIDTYDPQLVESLSHNAKTRDEFMKFATMFIGDMINAAMLEHACLGVRRKSDTAKSQAEQEASEHLEKITAKLQEKHDQFFLDLFKKNQLHVYDANKKKHGEKNNSTMLYLGMHEYFTEEYPFAKWTTILFFNGTTNELSENLAISNTPRRKNIASEVSVNRQTSYFIWCTLDVNQFSSKSMNKYWLEKAAVEFKKLNAKCSKYAKRNSKKAVEYLEKRSEAFRVAKHAMCILDDSKFVVANYGNYECSDYFKSACGLDIGCFLTF